MQWLVGINSLRSFAIFLIVIYHTSRSFLPGGFIAVDIFFAISGFLIIGKLIRESAHGKIHYWRFVLGRLLRIFPALLICVLMTLIAALFVHADVLAGMKQNTIAALTFTTNFLQLLIGGSYENSISPNLFQHTWFLALEMQLYIISPLVVMSVVKISKNHKSAVRNLTIISLIIAIISSILLAFYGGMMGLPDRAYFATDSHVGSFCLGAALAALNYLVPRTPRTPKLIPTFGVIVSLTTILILSFKLDYVNPMTYYFGLPFTGFLTAVMIFCIIKLQPNIHTRYKPVNVIRASEKLGSLAYGIYLFHYPLYLLLPNLLPPSITASAYVLIDIIASIIISIAISKVLHTEHGLKALRYYKSRRLAYGLTFTFLLIPALVSFVRMPSTSGITNQLNEMSGREELDEETEEVKYLGISNLTSVIKNALEMQLRLAANVSDLPKVASGVGAKSVGSANVLILGDSVTLGAKEALETIIPGAFVDARESRSIATAAGIIASYSAKSKLPNTIVISLATNEYDITDSLLQSIVNVAGKDKVFILVTAYAGPQQPREKQNATLKAYANKHSNIFVADWWEIAHSDWSLMYADHIHLNPEGRITYANLVYGAIRSARR